MTRLRKLRHPPALQLVGLPWATLLASKLARRNTVSSHKLPGTAAEKGHIPPSLVTGTRHADSAAFSARCCCASREGLPEQMGAVGSLGTNSFAWQGGDGGLNGPSEGLVAITAGTFVGKWGCEFAKASLLPRSSQPGQEGT